MTDTTATHADFQAHSDHHHDGDHKPAFFARWFMSTNHKDIGPPYLIFAIIAGLIGGAISCMMRAALAQPGLQFLQAWAHISARPAAPLAQAYHLWNVLLTAQR